MKTYLFEADRWDGDVNVIIVRFKTRDEAINHSRVMSKVEGIKSVRFTQVDQLCIESSVTFIRFGSGTHPPQRRKQ